MYQHSSDKDPNEVVDWLESERGEAWSRGNFTNEGHTNTNHILEIKEDPLEGWDLGAVYITHYKESDVAQYGRVYYDSPNGRRETKTPMMAWNPDKPPECA